MESSFTCGPATTGLAEHQSNLHRQSEGIVVNVAQKQKQNDFS